MTNTQNRVTVPPETAAAAAVLANAVGEEMLARLAWVTLQPQLILDVGSGAGHCTRLLQERYPAAQVVALDVDYPMLKYAALQAKSVPSPAAEFVCAEPMALPLPAQSVDLIFANLVLPRVADTDALLREWRRVLRPEGLLVFSSFGPDTLQAWRAALADFTLPNFVDMHEIGDALTRSRFADPVLDVDYISLTYREPVQLFAELQASGMLAADCRLEHVEKAEVPRTEAGRLAVTYEVVYGHAFGPDASVDHIADETGTVRIPLAHLRRR